MPANLSFAKIVASPTEKAWSQVYHAGNLFAVVGLTAKDDHPDLNSLGKAVFNTLEDEFFSLEKKTLETIREVIETSVKEVPEGITLSACIAFSKDAALYLFILGEGKILMKRGDQIGLLLKGNAGLVSSSGFLQHGDVLLLETAAFASLLTKEKVRDALTLHVPNDITEKLSSEAPDLPGDAACLTLMYQGASSPETTLATHTAAHEHTNQEDTDLSSHNKPLTREHVRPLHHYAADETNETEAEETEPHADSIQYHSRAGNAGEEAEEMLARAPVVERLRAGLPAPSRRVLIGIAAVLLFIVLLFSIFFTKQNNENRANREAYEQIRKEATQKYDEAEGLKNLNAALAQDDYKKAQEIIKTGLPKLKKGSEEEKELLTLLKKIEANLIDTEGKNVELKAIDITESVMAEQASKAKASFAASEENAAYVLTNENVQKDGEEIIKNENDWEKPAGISVYNGNVYVLDQTNGVLKYTAGSDGFGKSSYFSGDGPSMSKATGIGIDGSVYIAFSDGSMKKYTRGKEEPFTLSGLPTPIKNPKQVVTSAEMEDIYVLDSGNGRIVVLKKEGVFRKAYKAEALKGATLIDVREKDKKIYILNGKNLFVLGIE